LPVVRVDARAVAQVIYTLVENAAKYSPAGTSINVTASKADDETLRLSVEDEGPGVSTELRERVFDKFFRAMRDGDTGTRPPGIGMGLAIARGIVEAHGGCIWIEDTTWGPGTRVALTLPLGDEDEKEKVAEVKISGPV
jgi:two-component system sensor histidine kinase KdpD